MIEVAIITGGDSAERDISISSANVVYRNLERKRYNPTIINIQNNKWIAKKLNQKIEIDKKDFSLHANSRKIKFDYVFMALHGPPAENGELQLYFDKLNIPYSSCNAEVSANTFNKAVCNKKLSELGLRCPRSMHYNINEKIDIKEVINKLGVPCFIKPNQAGSSFGVSKAKTKEEIKQSINNAFHYDTEILIEEFIDGTEVSCGVIKRNNKTTALPITEIISQNEFFDFEAKYKGFSEEITPARINSDLTQEIQGITENIFDSMSLRGVCRVDFIIMNNKYYIIEINTIPGLSEESIIPKQIKEIGMSLPVFFDNWIKNTLNK